MKKTIISIFSVMSAMACIAQTYNMEITLTDGTKQLIPAENVSEVHFIEASEDPALQSLHMAAHLPNLFQLNIDNCPMLEDFEWGSTEKLQYANIYMTPLRRIDLSKINKDYKNIYLEYNDNLQEIKVWQEFDINNPPTSIQKPASAVYVYEFSEE